MWGVSLWPLKELLTLLGLPAAPSRGYGTYYDVPDSAPPARIVDCPDDEATNEALPEGVAAPLAALDDRAAKQCLKAWQKALGIRGKSVKLIETEFAEGSAWALRRIRALAAEADQRGANILIASRT